MRNLVNGILIFIGSYVGGVIIVIAALILSAYFFSGYVRLFAGIMAFILFLILTGAIFPWMIKNKLVIGCLILSAVTGLFVNSVGKDYLDSFWSRKDAFMRDKAIDNNVAESQLETFPLPAGTPLYNQKDEKADFYAKISFPLVVRLKPESLDIGGAIYRQVILPVRRGNAYIEGVWDSTSEHYLVEVISLTEGRREKKEVEKLREENERLKEQKRQRELNELRRQKEEAEKRSRKLEMEAENNRRKTAVIIPKPKYVSKKERSREIVFTQVDDKDPRPFGIRLDVPARLGERIRLLSDLIVRSDNQQQGAVVIGDKRVCCQKGSNMISLKKGGIYELKGTTIISITRVGASWLRLEKPLRLEIIES